MQTALKPSTGEGVSNRAFILINEPCTIVAEYIFVIERKGLTRKGTSPKRYKEGFANPREMLTD